MKRIARAFALAWLTLALPGFADPGHYIVVRDRQGALEVVFSAQVEMAGFPQLQPSREWEGHGNRLERRITAQTFLGGTLLHATDIADARWLRSESTHEDGSVHGEHLPKDDFFYVLRLPLVPRASRVLVSRPAGQGRAAQVVADDTRPLLEINLDNLPAGGPLAKASASDVFPILANGDPANRLDLLIVGDGYTEAQRAKFQQDALNIANKFLSISPYSDYRNYVNVTGLFVASAQSGATKPSCPETPGSPVVTVDTAFKATYCSSGLRRLVTVNTQIVLSTAAVAPNWDKVIVVVNDTEYGGSGGSVPVTSLNDSSVGILQHEFGHSFTLLADEYETPFPSYPRCSDVSGSSACEPNVTDLLSPLKWQGWVTSGTPVPTSGALSDPRAAGAWEGARFLSSGMYRQCFNGMMRVLNGPFCKVDGEAYVKRLYGSGWGVPASGISNIEPGSATPAGAAVSIGTGSTVVLGARLLGPASALAAVWRVDGTVARSEALASGASASFSYVAQAGSHTVSLTVTDASSLLLVAQASTRTWQVTGGDGGPFSLSLAKSGSGTGTVSSNPAGISCGSTCSAIFAAGTAVTLNAAASGDALFAGWSGGTCSGSGACTVTMNGAATVTATFNTGTVGGAGVSPASLAFGGQSMRTTSPAQVVTISNPGNSQLTISPVSASTHFSVTHNCAALAPGATCAASVTFTPTQAGSITGSLTVGTAAGARSVALSGSGEQSLTTHYYRSILRRPPDAAGKSYWDGEAARVQALGANVNEVWFAMAGAFFGSQEYLAFNRDSAGYVTDLYQAFFNRAPDAAGLDYWKGQLDQGLPREVELAGFMFSPEFANLTASIFGSPSVRREIDVVVDFYRGLLSRLPDDAGFAHWLQRFRSAQCSGGNAVNAEVESISSQFALGAESAARGRTNPQYVGDLYNAFLRRGGDLPGVQYWIGQIGPGAQTREQIRRAFIGTPEFQGRVGAIISQGCLP